LSRKGVDSSTSSTTPWNWSSGSSSADTSLPFRSDELTEVVPIRSPAQYSSGPCASFRGVSPREPETELTTRRLTLLSEKDSMNKKTGKSATKYRSCSPKCQTEKTAI